MIRAVLFDLDNTLYPASSTMEDDVVRRMNAYASRFLRMSPEAALALRHERLGLYGTTLEWLMAEHGFDDPEDFFASVHPDGEEESVDFDPALRPFLESITVPRYVFTNAPMEHADRVLRKLGVADLFERVFDVRFNGLRGKPGREAVDRTIAATGVAPAEALFVDDVPRYVRGFRDAGGEGVLIDHFGSHPDSGLPTIRTIYELGAYIA